MTQELAVYYKFFVKSVLTIFTEALKFIGILAILYFVNPFVLFWYTSCINYLSNYLKIYKKRVDHFGKKFQIYEDEDTLISHKSQ